MEESNGSCQENSLVCPCGFFLQYSGSVPEEGLLCPSCKQYVTVDNRDNKIEEDPTIGTLSPQYFRGVTKSLGVASLRVFRYVIVSHRKEVAARRRGRRQREDAESARRRAYERQQILRGEATDVLPTVSPKRHSEAFNAGCFLFFIMVLLVGGLTYPEGSSVPPPPPSKKPDDMPQEVWDYTTTRIKHGANVSQEDAEEAVRAVWKFEKARIRREGRR